MLLAIAVMATACQRSEETSPSSKVQAETPAAAAQPAASPDEKPSQEMARMMELMQAIYGPADGGHVIAELPDYGDARGKSQYRITPVGMHEIAPDRVALVANANDASDETPGHGQPGLLNVYLLRKQDGKWKVERRFENVAEMGSWGRLGSVEWVELGEGRPGFAVVAGGTWQGISIRDMALFDLGDPKLRNLATKIGLVGSDNKGDCDERRHRCWSVKGKWRFERTAQQAYDDLVFDFSGYTESRPEDSAEDVARSRSAVSNSARYALRDGDYVLASGEHSVPNP
ncbi:hypothetical protein [Duganella sp. CF458]|uniref:hypothetical protein n=1 Tax=Duganella sp. CF458 TaxID=1884368 RepID=UPI0011144D7A|nr:hypothetical protein [Duganella sp. CF458]